MYVCCSFLPIISRIGYYLTITHIFFIPALLEQIENKKLKKLFTLGVVLAGILYFAAFLYKATDVTVKILPYSTWIFEEVEFVPLFEAIQY